MSDTDTETKHRKKAVTMTKRSLDYLRKHGYVAAVVEQWIRFPKRENGKMVFHNGQPVMDQTKRDLFNLADIVAIHAPDQHTGIKQGTLFVQSTTIPNQAARIDKIKGVPVAYDILRAGNQIEVHGWAKKGARGARKLWQVTVTKLWLVNGVMATDAELREEVEDSGETAKNLFTSNQTEEDDF